jgi:hypothetical protein
MPLERLWTADGELATTRLRVLDRAALRELLARGPVRFVVADSGHALRWVPPSECFTFWKTDGAVHLADGERIDLDAFPDGRAYVAAEWAPTGDGVPIILLEVHH